MEKAGTSPFSRVWPWVMCTVLPLVFIYVVCAASWQVMVQEQMLSKMLLFSRF